MGRPIVERVAPELSIGRKIIRRHARDGGGAQRFLVELEEVRTRPHVRTVERGEDRGIANDGNTQLRGTRAERLPLPEEKILDERVGFGPGGDLLGERRLLRAGEGPRFGRPFPPRPAFMVIFERGKQGVAREPVRVVGLKAREVTVRERRSGLF